MYIVSSLPIITYNNEFVDCISENVLI